MVYRIEYDNDKKTPPQQGYWQEVTLRDYFAAKALNGFIATFHQDAPPEGVSCLAEALAKMAYTVADAMLKSRTEPKL